MAPRTSTNRRKRLTAPDRDKLVEDYLPLVRHVVTRIAAGLPSHVDSEELFQVGSVGLLNASRGFDPERGVTFKTYAFTLIRGSILDELRRLDVVPRSTRERLRGLDRCFSRLCQELGRPPRTLELAEALGTSEDAVEQLFLAARTVAILSLDDTAGNPESALIRDQVPCPDAEDPVDAAVRAELVATVARFIQKLPTQERRVITMYYREGLLLRQIGEVLGVSESRVSQIHSRALYLLHRMLRPEDGFADRP